jgi:hypothetical protein
MKINTVTAIFHLLGLHLTKKPTSKPDKIKA